MSEAAPQAAGGTYTEDVQQALDYLLLLWGDEFLIGHDDQGYDDQGYWAAPHGQIGHIMRADDPGKLGELMNDYAGAVR
jgi:hypothetical protein